MIRTNVSIRENKDAAGAVASGVERTLLDAGQRGLNVSLEHVPHGATSGLAHSAFGPEVLSDGSVVWGYGAEYSRYVEEGTRPHTPPIAPLKRWARRVLGDESAAWAVQRKIAEEGTPAQRFAEKGKDAMVAFLNIRGFTAAIEDEL